jgi:hypothetical protein
VTTDESERRRAANRPSGLDPARDNELVVINAALTHIHQAIRQAAGGAQRASE